MESEQIWMDQITFVNYHNIKLFKICSKNAGLRALYPYAVNSLKF